MTWILYDAADQRTPAPSFCLDSVQGRRVCRDDYRGWDNLVVFFPPEPASLSGGAPTSGASVPVTSWREVLKGFASHRQEYDQNEAVILAILPREAASLESDPSWLALPFPVLADPDRKVRREYSAMMDASLVREGDGLLFVLDKFGGPYAALVEKKFDAPAFHRDVLKWLEYISMQCPE